MFFPVIINTDFKNNVALDSGGAVYFRYANNGVLFSHTSFQSNTAYAGGGAMTFSSFHSGVKIMFNNFSKNSAKLQGGGVLFFNSNGEKGSITLDANMYLDSCVFTENIATSGGNLYVGDENIVQIVNTKMSQAHAFSRGGSVYAGTQNTIILNQTMIYNNTADLCGGGIASLDRNNINIMNTNFSSNKGTAGGAMCLTSSTTTHFNGKCNMNNNTGNFIGGAIVSIDCPLWTLSNDGIITLSKNKATRGSALFFKGVPTNTNKQTVYHDRAINSDRLLVSDAGSTMPELVQSNVDTSSQNMSTQIELHNLIFDRNIAR
jgi:hypothetical protein